MPTQTEIPISSPYLKEKGFGFTMASIRLISDVVRIVETNPAQSKEAEKAIVHLLRLKSLLMREIRGE